MFSDMVLPPQRLDKKQKFIFFYALYFSIDHNFEQSVRKRKRVDYSLEEFVCTISPVV